MAINLTDSLNAATTKGKLGDAKQVYLNGDAKNLQQAYEETSTHFGTLDNRSTQMEKAIQDISVTGGASTANAVSYNNSTSKLEAITAQSAIDELVAKNATEKVEVTAELEKKFDKESILQELGDAEDKVMSQKVVSNKLSDLSTNKLNKINLPFKDVKENGIYFADESGNVFLLYSPENGLDVSKISKDMADKVLAFLSLAQEIGTSEDKAMSQKAVSTELSDLSTNKLNKIDLPLKDVKEKGVYFVDEEGNAFMIYSSEKGLDVSKISQEMANKVLAFLNIEQELGDSPNSVISQKAVTDAITNIKIFSEVEEDGAYLCNEKGEVFARFVNGKFEYVGLEHINKLEDIKNVAGGSVGQFLQKQEDGSWSGTDISVIQSTSSLSGLTDVDINPVEGSILQYKSGKWVNAEISTEGMVTTDSRSNHPMYGKHFFAFGDSHTEGHSRELWQVLCELTGAIYHTLFRKKVSDGTYHFFSATTSTTDYSLLIDEEDTGIEVNCDGFNWAQYAHAAYTYAQSKGFHIDYILVENCHFNKWNFYNDDGSVKENIPIVLLNKTKVYSQIFENATAVMNFVSQDANIAKVVDELGFDSIDSSFDLRYGTASQELVFSFSNGNTLSTDCVAKIHFGNDTSKTISTTLSSGMSLTDCIDAINQWAFNEYSTWVNPSKGTQGNTKILLNYSSEVGGDSSTIANFEVTNSANLVMQQPTISVNATSWIHEYGLKDISGLRKSSSWLRSGGYVNWSLPNAMLGAMQYIGEHSPKTKFVFLGIWNNEMKEEYKYADNSVNPYDLIKSSSYQAGQTSKKSIKDIAELFGWQYIDVDKLCGITPFNVTPTFNDYNNVHMKKDGYRVSAECIAKYIK